MKMTRVVLCVLFVLAAGAGCGGGGCGGCAMQPIPGGFPAAKRHDNAGQIRVAQSLLTTLEADPGALLGQLGLGSAGSDGTIAFPVPGSCTGTVEFCCDSNSQPIANCGPLDMTVQALDLAPKPSGAVDGELDISIDLKLKTAMDIPVALSFFPSVSCGIAIDTAAAGGSVDHVTVVVPIKFAQNATSGQTEITTKDSDIQVNNLESADFKITGACTALGSTVTNGITSLIPGLIKSQLTGPIASAINGAACKACPTGDVAECGPFADSCDTNHVCQTAADGCYQELGITGRMPASSLFASFSPSTTGALDIYEVAGGYATSNNGGLALGLKGGMEGGGAPRDRCGPVATEPTTAAIPQSEFFTGNERPDTHAKFDMAIGIHKSQLDQFAYAGYDGGILCLTVDSSTSAMISSDTLGLIASSLGNIVDNSAPAAVGLRPQAPPVIALGKNTFVDAGGGMMTVADPLLDITFHQMEIDFFTQVDNHQFIRFMTVVADVHLPIGMQITAAGQLQPVLGDISGAFTNLSVKNSEALTDDPADLAAALPNLLSLVLPQLTGALPSFAIPSLGGLNLTVTDVTSVPTTHGGTTNDFLAIFANLAAAPAKRAIDTRVALVGVQEPADASVYRHPKQWASAKPPAITLALGAAGASGAVEYSVRLDHGAWGAWTSASTVTLAPPTLWFAGTHAVEVRAREVGHPESIDVTPAKLAVEVGAGAVPYKAPFHAGGASGGGCSGCQTGGGGATGLAGFAIVLGVIVRRRAKRVTRQARKRGLGALVWALAIALLPGCSCGADNPCGSVKCMDGDLVHGSFGKFTTIAGDDDRVLVATYDKLLGDLVVVDVTDPTAPKPTVADGLPDGVTPTYDPGSYRGGIDGAGPNVGAHTAIALTGGHAVVAYQDVDNLGLRIALEDASHKWSAYTLDPADGNEEVAAQTAIALDRNGNPVVTYLVVGVDDGTGHRTTELRVAHASSKAPGINDWAKATVVSGAGTCAGLCDAESCIAGMDGETCTAGTTDCTAACGSDQVCSNAVCVDKIPDPTFTDIPTGTGLFAHPVVTSDGRIAIVYYDRTAPALAISVESAAGSGTFAATVLDQATPGDRGRWANAVVDGSDVIHVAYQEALGNELFYTTFANGVVGTPEVVDDGERSGDRPHPVGQAASIYLVGGAPTIAYQDGLTADVDVATKSGAGWTAPTVLAGGLTLDGFSIGATVDHGGAPYIAWEQIVPANKPVGGLVVSNGH